MNTIENKEPLTLENVENIEQLPKLEIDDATEVLLSVLVAKSDGEYQIVEEVGIGKTELMRILKEIGYGGIGWERYNVVEKDRRDI